MARKRAREQFKPRSPEPVEGRKHIEVQTELYLEEITGNAAYSEVLKVNLVFFFLKIVLKKLMFIHKLMLSLTVLPLHCLYRPKQGWMQQHKLKKEM